MAMMGQNAPEKVGYTRYYEHDGMLRAYGEPLDGAPICLRYRLKLLRFRRLRAPAAADRDPCGQRG